MIYLGPNLPAGEIARAAVTTRASMIALSLVCAPDAMQTIREIRALREAVPEGIPLVLGGSAALRMRDRLRIPGVKIGDALSFLAEQEER